MVVNVEQLETSYRCADTDTSPTTCPRVELIASRTMLAAAKSAFDSASTIRDGLSCPCGLGGHVHLFGTLAAFLATTTSNSTSH